MIKKLILLGLIIVAAILFYQKFIAPTMESFFKGNTAKVGLF
jgi:hypothetical protein